MTDRLLIRPDATRNAISQLYKNAPYALFTIKHMACQIANAIHYSSLTLANLHFAVTKTHMRPVKWRLL